MKDKKYSKKHFLICLVVIIFATFFSGGPAKASTTGCSCYKSDKTAAGGNNNDISGASSTDQCNTICNGITGGSGFYDYRGNLNPSTNTVYFPITAISCACYAGSTQYSLGTASSESSCKTACTKTSNTVTAYSFGGNPIQQIAAPVAAPAVTTTTSSSSSPFSYQLLEAFPGFYAANATPNFPSFILAIYKFGIWTVGIAGLFMLTIGGFMYMASAGNTATASSAKGIIEDAIIGIIAAMCAYLILYVINPDLTKLNITFVPVTGTAAPNFGGTTGTAPTAGNSNSCGAGVQVVNLAVQDQAKGCVYSNDPRNGCSGSPGYTDCSNLVDSTYKNAGCTSPGATTGAIMGNKPIVSSQGSLKAGDAIGWPPPQGQQMGHVGICENDGCSIIIAAAGVKTGITTHDFSYWQNTGAKMGGLRVAAAASFCGNSSQCNK